MVDVFAPAGERHVVHDDDWRPRCGDICRPLVEHRRRVAFAAGADGPRIGPLEVGGSSPAEPPHDEYPAEHRDGDCLKPRNAVASENEGEQGQACEGGQGETIALLSPLAGTVEGALVLG